MSNNNTEYIANTVLMIRPNAFGFNPETASSNVFQSESVANDREITISAVCEFDAMVEVLLKNHIELIIVEDTEYPHTPDAIFPNNWFSTHDDGTVILYPMMAANRRMERRTDIIDMLKSRFAVNKIHDLSGHEQVYSFLEGTGSIVFDHTSRIAYAALSERTDRALFEECCRLLNYTPISFRAFHVNGLPVYHTNVLLHISPSIVGICSDMIHPSDRGFVLDALQSHGHHMIKFSGAQVHQFAGNMLCILNAKGEPCLIGSKTGYASLTDQQSILIQQSCIPVSVNIPTIERIGGGSARCMLAEIYLPIS